MKMRGMICVVLMHGILMPVSVRKLLKENPDIRPDELAGKNITSLVGLSEVPGIAEAEVIDLRNNKIQSLLGEQLKGPKGQRVLQAKELNISHNKINRIARNAFKYLKNLNRLDLRKNSLEQIPAHLFKQLSQLKFLELSHNKLKDLKPGTSAGLSAIEYLSLWGNELTEVKPPALEGLGDSLKHLVLSYNKIKYLEPRMFKRFTHLEQLDINNNKLSGENLAQIRQALPGVGLRTEGNAGQESASQAAEEVALVAEAPEFAEEEVVLEERPAEAFAAEEAAAGPEVPLGGYFMGG